MALREMVPNADPHDIDSLINEIHGIYEIKKNQVKDINEWLPSKAIVKEILNGQVKVADLHFCIEDFKTFSRSKGWDINDNLDAKLIAHIKIMAHKNRISLDVPE